MKISIYKDPNTKELTFFPCFIKKEQRLPDIKPAKLIEGAIMLLFNCKSYFVRLRNIPMYSKLTIKDDYRGV